MLLVGLSDSFSSPVNSTGLSNSRGSPGVQGRFVTEGWLRNYRGLLCDGGLLGSQAGEQLATSTGLVKPELILVEEPHWVLEVRAEQVPVLSQPSPVGLGSYLDSTWFWDLTTEIIDDLNMMKTSSENTFGSCRKLRSAVPTPSWDLGLGEAPNNVLAQQRGLNITPVVGRIMSPQRYPTSPIL